MIVLKTIGLFLSLALGLTNNPTIESKAVATENNLTESFEPYAQEENNTKRLYHNLGLKDKMAFSVFERALIGLENQDHYSKNIISIVDFTKPSSEKRLTIIDLDAEKVLYYTYVAHGKFTGENESEHYSNVPQSKKSSLGFYKTAETYNGKHGYSLRLDGLEEGINHNARSRAIVLHGANYVSEEFIQSHGRLGRSWGCPAVANELSQPIINTIKGGSCLYIFDNDVEYLENTKF